jgi:hypothetical protein
MGVVVCGGVSTVRDDTVCLVSFPLRFYTLHASRHNVQQKIETHVSGSQRVSIVSSSGVLLSAERHGAEQKSKWSPCG